MSMRKPSWNVCLAGRIASLCILNCDAITLARERHFIDTKTDMLLIVLIFLEFIVAKAVVIDDFSNPTRYAKHQNALGGWTSDDGSLAGATVKDGALMLSSKGSGYWYTVAGDCLDASAFTGICVDVKGATGGENFVVNVQTKNPESCGAKGGITNNKAPIGSFLAISKEWQKAKISFAKVGAVKSAVFGVALEFSSQMEVSLRNLEFCNFEDSGSTGGGGGDHGTPGPFEKGMSAWVYKKDDKWLSDLRSYDQAAPEGQKMKYLFPYSGWVGIGVAGSKGFDLVYENKLTSFYKGGLKNTDMYPNIDSSDGAAFRRWSKEDMEWAAAQVAEVILGDAAAKGVHMDVEPFYMEHLPFYRKLKELLNAKDKHLTMYTGRADPQVLKVADLLVVSGYDQGAFGKGWVPSQFGRVLGSLVSKALSNAALVGGNVMVGIPAIASTTEFENIVCGSKTKQSGHTQAEYMKEAMAVLDRNACRPGYVGASLWAFTKNVVVKGCALNPDSVSDAVWDVLRSAKKPSC